MLILHLSFIALFCIPFHFFILPLQEKDANSIEIPNISYEVFEAMMRFVYTGQVNVRPEIAFELLQVGRMRLGSNASRIGHFCTSRVLIFWLEGTGRCFGLSAWEPATTLSYEGPSFPGLNLLGTGPVGALPFEESIPWL